MYYLIDIGMKTIYAAGPSPSLLLLDFRERYPNIYPRDTISPWYYEPVKDLLLNYYCPDRNTWDKLQAKINTVTNYVKIAKLLFDECP